MFNLTAKKPKQASRFSKFFHEATSAEKKKVFKEVIRKASEEQRKIMNS